MRTGWANYLDNLNKTTFVSHKEYNPDFLNLSAITKNNLKQFGEQNPDVKNGFIESCKQAYESVNSAIKNRTFVELREQVLNQRQKLIDEREKKFVIANILAGVIDKKTEEEAIKLAKLNVENTEKNKIISGIMTGLIQKKEDEENIRKIKEDFEKELLETMKKIEQTAKKELQKTLDVNHPFLPKKINDELLNVMYEQVLIGDKSSDDYKKLKEKRLTIERNYHQAFVNYFNSDFFKKTGKNSKSIFFYPNSGYAGVRLAKLPEEQNRLVIAIDTHIFLELIEQLDHIAKIYTNRFNGTKEEAENILSHMQDKFSKISFPADRNSIMVLKDFKILVNSCQNYLKQKRNSKDNMKRDIYEQIQHQILIQYNKITQENNGKKKG